jgi:preprotein translocase subunit Sec63
MSTAAADLDRLLAAYRALDVDVGASARAIRFRYRELVRQHHPDRWPEGSPEQARAQERMREINAAYDLIESAPLRDHEFPPDPVRSDSTIGQYGVARPPSVLIETLARLALGAAVGVLFALMLYARGMPGFPIYVVAIPIVLALAFSSTSPRVYRLLRLFWWWW